MEGDSQDLFWDKMAGYYALIFFYESLFMLFPIFFRLAQISPPSFARRCIPSSPLTAGREMLKLKTLITTFDLFAD